MPRAFLRFVRLLLLALMAVLLCLGLLLAWGLPQGTPAVVKPDQMHMAEGGFSSRLLGRAELGAAFRGEAVSVSLTAQELNAVLQDLTRRMLGGASDVSLAQDQATVILSLPMGRTPLRVLSPLGDWLNVRATVIDEAKGLPRLASVRVGRLPVPPWLALWAARRVVAHYQLSEPVEMALLAVDSVLIEPQQAKVTVRWQGEANARVLELLVPAEDHDRLQAYQKQLIQLMAGAGPNIQPFIALPQVLQPMFEQARQRTLAQAVGNQALNASQVAARENRAVLVVLALYAGQVPLDRLMPAASAVQAVSPGFQPRQLTLLGRGDFAQHFLLSALLANDVGGRLADAVGIYKEMMDTRRANGGSGFSFNDLAADRAGIRFGQRARQAPLDLQARVVEGRDDRFFMPEVADLPQFLSESDFQRLYGQVGSAPYNAVMQEIDRRVSALPVLQ